MGPGFRRDAFFRRQRSRAQPAIFDSFFITRWRGGANAAHRHLTASLPRLENFRASALHIFDSEAVIPALHVPNRGRGEMHRAAQRVRAAVALEKPPPRRDALVAVGV